MFVTLSNPTQENVNLSKPSYYFIKNILLLSTAVLSLYHLFIIHLNKSFVNKVVLNQMLPLLRKAALSDRKDGRYNQGCPNHTGQVDNSVRSQVLLATK
jgi:hypothetical protein